MTALLLDSASWVLLVAGGVACIIGSIGLLRLPDFFSRTHAGGVTDTLGAPCIFLGLLLQAGGDPLVIIKLILILIFLFFTSPTAGHAMARAALTHGLSPLLRDGQFDEALREGMLDPEAGTMTREDPPSA